MIPKHRCTSEARPKVIPNPPAIESFRDPHTAVQLWPEQITADPTFIAQIEARQQLMERLEVVLNSLPGANVSIETAIDSRHVTEQQVAQLYTSLSDLLENSNDYHRIVLYLPFELLPNAAWQPDSTELQQASNHFQQAYLNAWEKLLTVHDVRANFVDGDVLEIEQRNGDLPRVVKAAHLIPILVQHGILETHDVLARLVTTHDAVLKHSIADTLLVLYDLGLLPKNELDYLELSGDPVARDIVRQISEVVDAPPKTATTLSNASFPAIQTYLQAEFLRIDSTDRGTATTKRSAWLCADEKRQVIETVGNVIGTAIATGVFNNAGFLTSEANLASQHALVEGIRIAVESVAQTDAKGAKMLYEHYCDVLLSLWQQDSSVLRNALAKTFRRLHRLDLVEKSHLAELDLTASDLARPFSKNLAAIEPELVEIQQTVAAIKSSEQLAQLIYPVCLIFGSRLKGYGDADADIDRGVLVRPGVSLDRRDHLHQLLADASKDEQIRGEVTEYWLKETAGGLAVHDFAEHDVSLGESHDTHVLFGAAWIGEAKLVHRLREQLLLPYLRETGRQIHGREARGLYLEELERDALLYRLLHKGYARFYPPSDGIAATHTNRIDGQSTFWDSGYRQVATRLYISTVFLPKVPSIKK